MEVSSHALELQRVYGLTFATVAYTNLTQDHLDFHGNMKSYFLAKARLFQEYNYQTAVINIDDPYGLRLLGMISRPAITYSLASPAAVQAIDVKQTIEGLQIRARTPQGELEFRSPLVGKFNVYNLLCGLAAAESLGLHSDEFIGAAEKFRGAPGRMERFDLGQRWVYVDYAHTPDALRQVIAELRELTRGPVHVLFGCGGNRDRGKRSLMGQAADELADRIYLTTDNPRDEDPEEITAEILAGITQRQKTLTILNRREAIRTALDILPRHGVLLIAGKGHEDYQEIRGVKYPFDDRAEVRQYLAEKGN